MARLHTGGAEQAFTGNPEYLTQGASQPTRDTTVFRSGLGSAKCNTGAGNGISQIVLVVMTGSYGGSGRTNWIRGYMRFDSAGNGGRIFANSASLNSVSVRLTAGGKLQLWNDQTATQIGSDSAATIVTDGSQWYRIEIKLVFGAASITDVELQLDGVTVASVSGASITIGTAYVFGWPDAPGANRVCYVDDTAVNDDQGATQNTWPGAGNVIMMKPSSDSQRGSWTGGAGGTTNLWDALDNVPPTGTASETDTTQIESIDSSGDNATDEYRGSCGTYLAAGIGASDTVNAIVAVTAHGEDVTTGTKTGSLGMQANPATTYSTFTFGNDIGALGTFASGWAYSWNVASGPTVTLSSALILAVRKTDSGTRVASICSLFALVDYTPAAGALLKQPGFVDHANPGVLMQGLRRAWQRRRSGIFVPDLWLPESAII